MNKELIQKAKEILEDRAVDFDSDEEDRIKNTEFTFQSKRDASKAEQALEVIVDDFPDDVEWRSDKVFSVITDESDDSHDDIVEDVKKELKSAKIKFEIDVIFDN